MPDLTKVQRDIRSYEGRQLVAELVGKARTVLNVGPSWGRDSIELTRRGKRVVNVDITPHAQLDDMVVTDANHGLPFIDNCFDVVVLAEVLEHLVDDAEALRESRRLLVAGGRLLVTVPFYHDVPVYHVRVHSARSIGRLLEACGFSVEHVVYRGGCIRFPRLVHAIRKTLSVVGLDAKWYRLILSFDRWLGQQKWFARFSTGVYIRAKKAEPLDSRRLNSQAFGDAAAQTGSAAE